MRIHKNNILITLAILEWTGLTQAQVAGVDILPYPGAEVFRMGDLGRVNGQDYRIYYFTTQAPLSQVIQFYQETWGQKGQLLTRLRLGSNGMGIGYFDLIRQKSYSVSVFQVGNQCYGFPAITQGVVRPWLTDSTLGEELPIYPGAQGIMSHESLDPGASFRTVSYSTPASIKELKSFFLKEMGKQGYSLSEDQKLYDKEPTVFLDFVQGRKKISVSLTWAEKYHLCSVFMVQQKPQTRL